jgi:hypothetical protein
MIYVPVEAAKNIKTVTETNKKWSGFSELSEKPDIYYSSFVWVWLWGQSTPWPHSWGVEGLSLGSRVFGAPLMGREYSCL